MPFRLLDGFRNIFEGQAYRHRSSTQGDRLARLVYEDLYAIDRSTLLRNRIDNVECVVNLTNRVTGLKVRRGDGTFGESLQRFLGLRKQASQWELAQQQMFKSASRSRSSQPR